MTIEEFQKLRVHAGMKVEYDGRKYDLMSVCWEQNLVAINIDTDDDLKWLRCENIKLYDS